MTTHPHPFDPTSAPVTGFPATPQRASMPDWYGDLLASVRDRVATGRQRALASVNSELVLTYWHIGREILARQDREGYGTKVIDRLSADLREAFPDAKGFSPRDLKYMRAFADAWSNEKVVQAPLAQLPWYHQLALLDRVPNKHQRFWYAAQAAHEGWSGRVLIHQIETRLHERAGKAITNFDQAIPGPHGELAQQLTKDPYLFDFLSVTETKLERDLERALLDHVTDFLLELGQGFALYGRQVRLVLGGDEFVCDLVFYHVRLRCFVIVELKATPFDPRDLGQLNMYLAAADELLATEGDAPTIGLVLCRSKNSVVAEYALRGHTHPMGVAEWASELTTDLPAELAASLPSIEELEAELSDPKEGP